MYSIVTHIDAILPSHRKNSVFQTTWPKEVVKCHFNQYDMYIVYVLINIMYFYYFLQCTSLILSLSNKCFI